MSSILCGLAAVIIITAAVRIKEKYFVMLHSSLLTTMISSPRESNLLGKAKISIVHKVFWKRTFCIMTYQILKVKNRHHLAAAAEALVKSGQEAEGKANSTTLWMFSQHICRRIKV